MARYAAVFLANDRYFDWVLTFLESLRHLNPSIELHWIPYNADCERVAALAPIYGFQRVEADYARIDDFAEGLFPDRRQRFNLRKYAALQLDCDELAYFDCDMMLFADPARLFGHIRPGDVDLVYLATSPGWVYRPDRMAEAYARFGAFPELSAGAFVTSGRALTLDGIISTIERNLPLYETLRHPELVDQPLLNFALDRGGKRCRHIRDCDPRLGGMHWFRSRDLRFDGSRLIEASTGCEVTAVHWAGHGKRAHEWFEPRMWRLSRRRNATLRRAQRRLKAKGAPAAA